MSFLNVTRLSVKRRAQLCPECSGFGHFDRGCDWSVQEGGRGFVYPECLDGGEDFLLMSSEGHAHSEQVFGVELRDDVQAAEARLQEALLVSLHLYGSEPLRDRTTC